MIGKRKEMEIEVEQLEQSYKKQQIETEESQIGKWEEMKPENEAIMA